jgi:hypothetical protein
MELSVHAQIRCKQPGISGDAIKIILKHGRESSAPGGSQKIFFGRKECGKAISELKKLMKTIERAKDRALLVSDDQVVTVYKQF